MQSDWRPRAAVSRFTGYAFSALLVAAASWLELLIAGSSARELSLTPFGLAVALSVFVATIRHRHS